ncbi:hypothetical protein BGX24_006750 [Mortierella sp. AD032]|nr:hypothetical protein BGX24_006750 [Mortierella sp. AD032]
MAVIQLITSSSPYLRRIDLTECRLLTNLSVQVIARLCGQLEELSLQGCGLITDDAIEEVALHCTQLWSINIGQCQRAGDKSLEALLRASGRMTQLDPTSKVRTRNAYLKRLGVAGCRGITYSGLTAITEHLNAVGSTESGDFQQPQRPSLVSLEFTDVINLVDQVGPGLKVLRFDHANAINSETLGHLLAVCPNLTVLSIPRASRLDDSGVIQLISAKCAGSLVELDLSACHLLSDGCLTALAKCTPAAPSTMLNDKGKGIQELDSCLFPNLRRLDLSYNDKMTLGGIIPLVMSLKNLCALDVSFCGDGVTRSWSSTLESLQPILNPTSTSSVMDSTGIDDLLGDTAIESDHSEDDESSSSFHQQQLPQYSPQQELQMQFSSHAASLSTGTTPPTSTQQYGLSSQNLQRFTNGVAPLVNPSRLGLGRYVGPLLNRTTTTVASNITTINNEITAIVRVLHDIVLLKLVHVFLVVILIGIIILLLGVRLLFLFLLILIVIISREDYTIHSYNRTKKKQPPPFSTQIILILLAERLDILENTPRRVGIAASFYLESWFTPQHQLQLQHLFQIQNQHQRDLQDLQATLAVQQQAAAIAFQVQPLHATTTATNGTLLGNPSMTMPFAALSAEMMNHPVMTAIRVGAATVGGINNGNGGGGGGGGGPGPGGNGAGGAGGVVHGGMHGTGGNDSNNNNNHNHNNETFVYHGNRRLSSTTTGDGLGTGSGIGGAGSGSNRAGVRHHHRHHYQHSHYHRQRNPLLSGVATGHCEISAWGLSKLREEWAAVI